LERRPEEEGIKTPSPPPLRGQGLEDDLKFITALTIAIRKETEIFPFVVLRSRRRSIDVRSVSVGAKD